VAADFDARFSATARTYRYVVLNRAARSALEARRSLWWPRPVDLERLAACAALLPGEHDFSAFTPAESQHSVFVRIIREAAWERLGDQLHFTVTADSFLRHMVRTLVGTMLQASPERMATLLGGRPRFEGGATAPPWGLYLERVEYGGPPVS
jgi:tRNA pseudouridine38-40 synthase